MTGSRIASLGIALPERELTNEELASSLGVDAAWIYERTGIETRRIAGPLDTAGSLGTTAAARALAAAGLAGDDVDLVVCATVTPDWTFPATACLIQSGLGSRAAAFDLNAGCAGWLVALAQAHAAIDAGLAERVLVVGCDVLSRITDPDDAKTVILFGDGAGAAVVEKHDGVASVGPFSLYSDGSRPHLLHVANDTGTIRMDGRAVYRAAVSGMADAVRRVLEEGGVDESRVGLVVAHQANARILDAVAVRLGLPPHKMFSNIERYGNTSAASIPIALAEADAAGRLHDGDVLVLAAFGAGFVWGAGLMRWTPRRTADRELALAGAVGA